MTIDLFTFLKDQDGLSDLEKFYARLAVLTALESKDITRVGSVIYNKNLLISKGFNKLSKGVLESQIVINEENKSLYTIHSEENAITNSAKLGLPVKGASIIIVGKYPCSECAKSIINAGIVEVICPPLDANSRWKESNLIARELFNASNIKVRIFKELIGVEFGLTCSSKYIV